MFKYFDANNTDEITFEDLKIIHERNGETSCKEEDLKNMIKEADPQNETGKINFETFKKIMIGN